jgi:hypothetical protein
MPAQRLAHLRRVLRQEVFGQQRDVLAALAQRGQRTGITLTR